MQRQIIVCFAGLLISQVAVADIAKHTTATRGQGGSITEYTEMVADDNGNLRVEIYTADAAGERGELRDLVVFQASERQMITTSGGMCQSMSLDGESLPGGVTREDITAAQAEMQKALEQMRADNPEMAKMLEAQMGDSMALMTDTDRPPVSVTPTGEKRKIDGYDTEGFQISGVPMAGDYKVWATDIDDVEGAHTISAASQGMMQATRQMMENMGLGDMPGANLFNEVLDAMDNYYPIVTEDSRGTTALVSTNGNGSTDFYPACN